MRIIKPKKDSFSGNTSIFFRDDKSYEVSKSETLPEGFEFGFELDETGDYVSQTNLGTLYIEYTGDVNVAWNTPVGYGGDYTFFHNAEIKKNQLGCKVVYSFSLDENAYGVFYEGDSLANIVDYLWYSFDGMSFFETPELIICPKVNFAINKSDYSLAWLYGGPNLPEYFWGQGIASASSKYFAGFNTATWEYLVADLATGEEIYSGDLNADFGVDVQPDNYGTMGFLSTMEDNVFIGFGLNMADTAYSVFLMTVNEDRSLTFETHPGFNETALGYDPPTLDGLGYWDHNVYLIDPEDGSYYFADGHYGYMDPIYLRKYSREHQLLWESPLPTMDRPWPTGGVVSFGDSVYMFERRETSFRVSHPYVREFSKETGEIIADYDFEFSGIDTGMDYGDFGFAKKFTSTGDLYFMSEGASSTEKVISYFSAVTKEVGIIGTIPNWSGDSIDNIGTFIVDSDDNAYFIFEEGGQGVNLLRVANREIFVSEVDFGGAAYASMIENTLLISANNDGEFYFFYEGSLFSLKEEVTPFREINPGVPLVKGRLYKPGDEWSMGFPNITYNLTIRMFDALGGKIYGVGGVLYPTSNSHIIEVDPATCTSLYDSPFPDTASRNKIYAYNSEDLAVFTNYAISLYNINTKQLSSLTPGSPGNQGSNAATYVFERGGIPHVLGVNSSGTINTCLHSYNGSSWTTLKPTSFQFGYQSLYSSFGYDPDNDSLWMLNVSTTAPLVISVFLYNWATNVWDLYESNSEFLDGISRVYTGRYLAPYDGVLYSKGGFSYNTDTNEFSWFAERKYKDDVLLYEGYNDVRVDRINKLLLCSTFSADMHVVPLEDGLVSPW